MGEAPRGMAGWIVRRLPAAVRDRSFMPAYYDLVAERLTDGGSTTAPRHVVFHFHVLAIACQAAAIAIADCRPGRVDRMLLQDLRFAARTLRKNPRFTLVAAAIIALGIGANTAMFSVVHAVLLRPLPFAEPSRVMRIHESLRGRTVEVAPPNYVDWRQQSRAFTTIAAYQDGTMTLGGGASPERLDAGFVTADVFRVLDVPPALGRAFTSADERTGSAPVVLLGHAMWQTTFGGDPAIVGRRLRFESRDYEVVGVMPAGFAFPHDIQLWFPLILTESDTSPAQRGAHYIAVIGRLAPGATPAQAQAELTAIEMALAARYSQVQGYGVWVEPLLDSMVGEVRRPLLMLVGAVGFVLLIACVNVSNLLLARATVRSAEIAVRAALGAGRWRIVRQLLVESLMLSLAGGLGGVGLAIWGVRALSGALPADLPRTGDLGVHPPVLLFGLLVSLATGVVFGIAPAIYSSLPSVSTGLRLVARDGSISGRRRLRRMLIAGEIAVALVLLAGAGLMIRSVDRLSRVDPGFERDRMVSFRLSLPDARDPSNETIAEFYRSFLERISALPGVESVGAVTHGPLSSSGFGGTFSIIGRDDVDDQRMQVRAATPKYFETLHVPLRRGRTFTAADGAGAGNVAIISEGAARRFWPGEDPIGKRIRIHVSYNVREREREIIGVVGDVRIRSLEVAAPPVAYVPHAQYVADAMTVFVRTAEDPLRLLPTLRAELARVDADIAMTGVRRAEAIVSSATAQPRFRMVMFSTFAAMALGLAALGLYGVMAYSIGLRRSELGLRMALGADRGDLLRLVLRDGLEPVVAGIAIGLLAAAALTRLMSTLIFGISPYDPATFLLAPLLLTAVAAAACYLPARRAARADPSTALRG